MGEDRQRDALTQGLRLTPPRSRQNQQSESQHCEAQPQPETGQLTDGPGHWQIGLSK